MTTPTPHFPRQSPQQNPYLSSSGDGAGEISGVQHGADQDVPPPDRMYIESTSICNLNCIMCPTGRGDITRTGGFHEVGGVQADRGRDGPASQGHNPAHLGRAADAQAHLRHDRLLQRKGLAVRD